MRWRKALGFEHPGVANSSKNGAGVLGKISRDDLSEKMEARAKAIRAKHAEANPAQ